jgi:hypothetical protein
MKLAPWTRMHTLGAGIALIALTNAVALTGVAYNRSGEPESRLLLTQREFSRSDAFRLDRESGGLTLRLHWRVLGKDPSAETYYGGAYIAPAWLDGAKLADLGFDVSESATANRRGRRLARQLPREALIVLELDGPAYREALDRAERRAAKDTANPQAKPEAKRNIAERLKREQTAGSRLFAVDAGLDAAALRAKYPDRARHAIVQGSIRMHFLAGGKDPGPAGYIERVANDRINVPLEFQTAIVSAPRPHRGAGLAYEEPPFQVTVAFGKRFEPWLVSAAAGKTSDK